MNRHLIKTLLPFAFLLAFFGIVAFSCDEPLEAQYTPWSWIPVGEEICPTEVEQEEPMVCQQADWTSYRYLGTDGTLTIGTGEVLSVTDNVEYTIQSITDQWYSNDTNFFAGPGSVTFHMPRDQYFTFSWFRPDGRQYTDDQVTTKKELEEQLVELVAGSESTGSESTTDTTQPVEEIERNVNESTIYVDADTKCYDLPDPKSTFVTVVTSAEYDIWPLAQSQGYDGIYYFGVACYLIP